MHCSLVHVSFSIALFISFLLILSCFISVFTFSCFLWIVCFVLFLFCIVSVLFYFYPSWTLSFKCNVFKIFTKLASPEGLEQLLNILLIIYRRLLISLFLSSQSFNRHLLLIFICFRAAENSWILSQFMYIASRSRNVALFNPKQPSLFDPKRPSLFDPKWPCTDCTNHSVLCCLFIVVR